MCEQATGNLTTEIGVFTVMLPGGDEPRPFAPEMLGLKATGFSTGCYDGYVASYAMWKSRLYLAELEILANRRELPDICGIYPEGEWDAKYRGLRLPLGFCGDIYVTPGANMPDCWGGWGDDKVQFRLNFHGGVLRDTENFTNYRLFATTVKYSPPRDQPVDHLPLRDRSTPFDEYVIPLTEDERRRIAEEAAWDAEREAWFRDRRAGIL
jgi:hypothetical protein